MKKTLATGLVLVQAVALVSSAFAGAVKTHLESMKASGKPEVFAIDHGEYVCSSCEPPVKLRVNVGAQKVAGHSEYDQMVVAIRSPTSIEIVEELNGKHQAYYGYKVSADGKTLTVTYSDWSTGKEEKGGYTATRVAPGPAGSHAVSGSWKVVQTQDESSGTSQHPH